MTLKYILVVLAFSRKNVRCLLMINLRLHLCSDVLCWRELSGCNLATRLAMLIYYCYIILMYES